MSDPTPAGADPFQGSRLQFVLRYLKLRWVRDTRDLLEATGEGPGLRFDDLDLDQDLIELAGAGGRAAAAELARLTLEAREPLPASSSALAALAPELSPAAGRAFLHLLAVNLAFRFRTDPLLAAIAAFAAEGPAPRLEPAAAGALLARARSVREARALIEASPLTGAARDEALAAAVPGPAPTLPPAWLHVEAGHDALGRGLDRALAPWAPIQWVEAGSEARRYLALRPRGGWVTVLEESGRVPVDVARAVARTPGVARVAWLSAGGGRVTGLLVLEHTRTLLDLPGLTARLGAEPELDDVLGALRGLGVLDLDPEHPRRPLELRFAAHLGSGGSLGGLKKKRVTAFAYAPEGAELRRPRPRDAREEEVEEDFEGDEDLDENHDEDEDFDGDDGQADWADPDDD